MDRTQKEGIAFIFLAVLGYSVLPVLTKRVLASGMPPVDMAVWRFLFAAPAMWLLIWIQRQPHPAKPLPRLRLAGMGVFLALAALAAFFGLQYLPAGMYVVLFYTYPAMVAILSALLGKPLPPIGWAALALTLIGVTLTVPDLASGLSGDSLLGVLIALANAFVVAVYFILNEHILRGHRSMARASGWALNGALMALLGAVLAQGGLAPAADLSIWVHLVLLAMVSTVMPVFALFQGIQRLGSSRAAIMGTMEPILTLIWAMIFLGEVMQPVQVLGGAFVLSSVILLALRRPQAQPVEAASSAG